MSIKTGDVIGRWTVLERTGQTSAVLCSCGQRKVVSTASLTKGASLSCGCLRRLLSKEKATTHGMSHTRFYRIWTKMMERTLKTYSISYGLYGGRGISVCKRWHSFPLFKRDMFDTYVLLANKIGEKNVSIERNNVDKGYSPKNCQWIHLKDQATNRRSTVLVDFNGVPTCFATFCKELGLEYFNARNALDRGGIFLNGVRVERTHRLMRDTPLADRSKGGRPAKGLYVVR